MGRYGHGEALGASGTVLASEVQKPLQGVVRTGNANLQGRVNVGSVDRRFPSARLVSETGHGPLVQPDDDAHAIAVRVGVLHGTGAQVDQAQRVRVGERAGCHGGGEGAHRVSRHEVRCAAFLDQSPGGSSAVNEQSELGGDGRAESLGGVQFQHVTAEYLGYLCDHVAGYRVIGQVVQHTGTLRALAGK